MDPDLAYRVARNLQQPRKLSVDDLPEALHALLPVDEESEHGEDEAYDDDDDEAAWTAIL